MTHIELSIHAMSVCNICQNIFCIQQKYLFITPFDMML